MQSGQIRRVGNCWMVRYYEDVIEDGEVVRRRIAKKIATYGSQYRSKADVAPLVKQLLAPINAGMARPQSADLLLEFIEDVYLPSCKTRLRPSTQKCYNDSFKILKPFIKAQVRLCDFRTVDADKLLKDACAGKQRAHTTHRNLKSFLSGVFTQAKRMGAVTENPVRDAEIPRGKAKQGRAAYTLDEISAMLKVLPEPSRTVVLTAALTGLRLSELKGLRWEDFDGDSVLIQRAVWQGQVSDTKTLASKAYVPVVPQLIEALEEHKARNSGTGYVFHGGTGNPLRMENLFRDQMTKPLSEAKVDWRGWHPFRYGVATTLRSLGVDMKLIQQILRHSDQRVTMEIYTKPTMNETAHAMAKLEKALNKKLSRKKIS